MGDLGGGLVDDLLEAELALALLGSKRGKPLADGHQIAGPQQRVPADVLENLLVLARVDIGHRAPPEKCLERVAPKDLGVHHQVGLHLADVVDENLAQARRRVGDVDSAPSILLRHDRRSREPRIGFLADRGKHLHVVIDPPDLIGDLDQAELGVVPDVRRQLAGDTRVSRRFLYVLVEILVDAVDE